jgi:hypothetical protein
MTWMYWLGSGIIATVAVMGWSSCRTAGRGDEWDRMVACVRDFGHVAGSDDYWWDLACPGAMTAEQLDQIVRGAETVEIAGRYRLLYEFQLGRVDGWTRLCSQTWL